MKTMEIEKNTLPENYKAVAACLRKGKAEAITSNDIVRLTPVTTKRDVYEIIEQLVIRHGYVIGASRTGEHKGYYIIETQSELAESLHSYNEQIQSMLRRHKKLRENYLASTNQSEMGK